MSITAEDTLYSTVELRFNQNRGKYTTMRRTGTKSCSAVVFIVVYSHTSWISGKSSAVMVEPENQENGETGPEGEAYWKSKGITEQALMHGT